MPSHIVHLATSQALPVLRDARATGVPVTVETTHHYLCLASEDIPDGATEYKCCPPIRSSRNQVGAKEFHIHLLNSYI